MRRVFLDANVLFSAAWRPDAGLTRLWALPEVELVSSRYACEEARRNLPAAERRQRLERLLVKLQLCADVTAGMLPAAVVLPEKDRPILLSAIRAQVKYLLTGDRQHFGGLYGQTIEGVTVLRPADFFSLAKPGE